MKKLWEDFKKFISRGNVVDMAVGVAVASAFTAIVTAFTKGFITPLLALITGAADLSDLKWVVSQTLDPETGEVIGEIAFLWGDFLQKIIDFFIIALTLFLIMRIVGAIAEYTERIREAAEAALHKDELEAAEAKAAEEKAAAEAAAAAEAEAARVAAEAEAAKIKAEEERLVRQEQLLTEIRDLLKK